MRASCRRGCRRSASRAAASTSCRSTSSSTRWTTSRTSKDLDGKCFHLVDPTPMRVGDVLNIFAKAAHAPQMSLRVNAALLGFIPNGVKKGLMALTPVRRIRDAVMKDLGLPDDILNFVNYPTRFDCRETTGRAEGQRHQLPAAATTTRGAVGLLGAPPRPGPAHRPHAEGPGRRQGGADHRRLVGHRPGRGAQDRRGRRHHRASCGRDEEKLAAREEIEARSSRTTTTARS